MAEYIAKPTFYAGVYFRSRNEAKWARFFDDVGIYWEYEPRTFVGWNKEVYKPDFYFPTNHLYGEVKSTEGGVIASASKINGAIEYRTTDVANGLLLLGQFPYDVRVTHAAIRLRWLFWHKGVCGGNASIVSYEDDLHARIIVSDFEPEPGDPLPRNISPDVFIASDNGDTRIFDAINETNKFFMKEEYR